MVFPSTTTTGRTLAAGARRRAPAVAGIALSLVLGLSACTGSSSGGGTPTASRSGSTSATVGPATIKPTHAQDAIPADKDIVEVPALRRTVALTTCRAVSGGWSGGGTAKNPTSSAQTYHMLVFFTDKYSRTIDFARATVKVPAGGTKKWTATRKFDPPTGTKCVLRGLYAGSPKKNASPKNSSSKKKKSKKKN